MILQLMGVLSPALEKTRPPWRSGRSLWRSCDLDVGESSRFVDPHRLKPWVYGSDGALRDPRCLPQLRQRPERGQGQIPFGPKKHERLVALNEWVRSEQTVPPQAQH